MSALLPSRLVPEDMLSEWQGPNLPNTKNYAPAEDSIGGMIRNALLTGVAGVGGFTGLPMSDEGNRAALWGELLAAGMPLVGGVKKLRLLKGAVRGDTPAQTAINAKRAQMDYLRSEGVKMPMEAAAWEQASELSDAAMRGEIRRLTATPIDQLHPSKVAYLKAIGDVADDRGWKDIAETARLGAAKPSGGSRLIVAPKKLREAQ
jgi:hypothetical protein